MLTFDQKVPNGDVDLRHDSWSLTELRSVKGDQHPLLSFPVEVAVSGTGGTAFETVILDFYCT